MKFKFLDDISKKVGGNENLLIILLGILLCLILLAILRINFLINLFQNMCFYEYSSDYVCSCVGKMPNTINIDNLSFLP